MISLAIFAMLEFLVLDLELLVELSFLTCVIAIAFNMLGLEFCLLIRFIGLKGDLDSL